MRVRLHWPAIEIVTDPEGAWIPLGFISSTTSAAGCDLRLLQAFHRGRGQKIKPKW